MKIVIITSQVTLVPKNYFGFLEAFIEEKNKFKDFEIELEIIFSDKQLVSKSYTILCEKGTEIMKGKIAGFTQRTCLYIGELKKGKYQFQMDEQNVTTFEVI
jgi:hypothetical protein